MSLLNEEIEKKESILAAKRKEELVVQRHAEELRGHAKEAAAKVRSWQAKLRTLRLHAIEEDEDENDEGEEFRTSLSMAEGEGDTPSSLATPMGVDNSFSKDKNLKLPVYTEQQLAGMFFSMNEMRLTRSGFLKLFIFFFNLH